MRRSLGGAALVVVSIGLGAGGSVAANPAGRLLVVAEQMHESGGLNYPSDLYVVDIDGRHLRNLTHDNASNGPAEWMPDGRRIIFQSHASNTERGAAHIYVINRDGTGRRRLTSANGGALPDVSPDGRRIAFLIQRPKVWGGYAPTVEWGVYLMDASGRHQRRLVEGHGEAPGGPSWSADGRMIMFQTERSTRGGCCVTSLFVINSDGTGLTRLARSTTLSGASWSPRGRTLAIGHYDSSGIGTSVLTIADLRGFLGRPMLWPVKEIRDVYPGSYEWSPDGRSIVYWNDAGVWIADARRHASRRRFAVQALPGSWSPDGRWFVFASERGIEIASAVGRKRRIVTPKIKNCCPLDEIEWAPR